MAKVFFLSHSSTDKPLVRSVADVLGRDRCWIDEAEIHAGQSLLDRIDNGIADSRMFVLFWSEHSAASPWVMEELSQARLRALRDRGFRLVVVKLDATEIPLALAHRLYVDVGRDAPAIARAIEATSEDLAQAPKTPVPFADTFQNREAELARIERAALESEHAGVLLLGLSGMGKSALVRRAATQLFPHLLPIYIDLDADGTPIRLLAGVSRPLSLAVDVDAISADARGYWKTNVLPELLASEKAFLILDNYGTGRSYHRGEFTNELVQDIVDDLTRRKKQENPGLLLVATARPNFKESTLSRLEHISVRSLDEEHMIRALRLHLRRAAPDTAYKQDELRKLASALKGYPLALGLAAAQISQRGLHEVLDDIQYIHELVLGLASELIAGISLSADEKSALVTLATLARPLRSAELDPILGNLRPTIRSLSEKQLFDVTTDGLALHGIIQEYVRERLATGEQIKQAHMRISGVYEKRLAAATPQSSAAAEYGSLLAYHALAGGRRDADKLTSTYKEEYKEAAIELYRRRDYPTALRYLERIRELPGGSEPIVEFYYALALNRTGRSEESLPILRDLTQRFPNSSRYFHGLGTVLRRLRENEKAVVAFRRAAAVANEHDTTALVGLSEVLIDMGRAADAIPYAERAYKRDPSDSYVIATLASAYHESGDAKRALQLLQDALRRRKTDTRLHAKAGTIAKAMGDLVNAETHLRLAHTDPTLPFTITALADVYIELGQYAEAERVLESFPHYTARREPSYWSVRTNLLRHQHRYEEALEAAEKALKLDPRSAIQHGGMAQLQLELARDAARKGDREQASYRIELGLKAVRDGLSIDPDNAALHTIHESLAFMENPPAPRRPASG